MSICSNAYPEKCFFNNSSQTYLISIYSTTTFFTLCRLEDIYPDNPVGLIVSTLIIICGLFFFAYFYGTIIVVGSKHNKKLAQKEKHLRTLTKFLKNENVPRKIQTKIMSQLNYKSLSFLPQIHNFYANLYQNIVYHLYKNILKKAPIFEQINEIYLKLISLAITKQSYIKHEVICSPKDVISNIYIIENGVVLFFLLFNFIISQQYIFRSKSQPKLTKMVFL